MKGLGPLQVEIIAALRAGARIGVLTFWRERDGELELCRHAAVYFPTRPEEGMRRLPWAIVDRLRERGIVRQTYALGGDTYVYALTPAAAAAATVETA